MKKLVSVVEVQGEGLEALLDQQVTLLCNTYIYTGKLVGVNDKFVKLENPKIVYDTGPWGEKHYKQAESLPSKELYINLSAVESYGVLKL